MYIMEMFSDGAWMPYYRLNQCSLEDAVAACFHAAIEWDNRRKFRIVQNGRAIYTTFLSHELKRHTTERLSWSKLGF